MQRKIFLNFLIVLILGIFISSLLSIKIMETQSNNIIEDKLTSNAYLVREIIGDKLNNHIDEELVQYMKEIKNNLNMRITVVNITGSVIADTDADISSIENHHDRPEILDALKGKVGIQKRHSNTINEDLLYCAVPYYNGDKIVGVIRLSTRLADIKSIMQSIYINTFITFIIGLAITLFLGYRVAFNISKPIKEMTDISANISKGQLEKRIYIKSNDEIGDLANSINNMASKLDETIISLKDKNSKMEAILSSVINGIIAIDNNERILFINPSAIEMLDIKEKMFIGKHFLQVVRNNDIDDFLNECIRNNRFESTEITKNYPEEKSLKIFTSPIKYIENEDVMGIIIVINDITEIRKLERVRKEFVANVSHELKTPLTSIKGFAETLRYGALEDKDASERFLKIIEEEADRLFRLINDILTLSELENKKVRSICEKVNIEKIIEHVISIISNQADSKNIKISKTISENLTGITGDPDEIKQMLINLIDNAIKYTPQNGAVSLNAYNENSNLIIKVSDNGIGISKENISRLFERFYRVDKARSKKIGGTGLGLAIVKYIVKSYDGEIEVSSTVGTGSEFKIILPIKKA